MGLYATANFCVEAAVNKKEKEKLQRKSNYIRTFLKYVDLPVSVPDLSPRYQICLLGTRPVS